MLDKMRGTCERVGWSRLAIIAVVLVVYVSCFAWFVRLAALQSSMGRDPNDILPVYGSDSSGYVLIADNILQHHAFSYSYAAPYAPDTFRTPGYPVMLAAWKAAFGSVAFFPILQIYLVLLTALLILAMGKRIWSEGAGLLAALLFALDPNTIFHSMVLMSDIPYAFMIVLAAYLLFFHVPRRFLLFSFGIGTLLALAALMRPISAFLPIVLVPLHYWSLRRRGLLSQLAGQEEAASPEQPSRLSAKRLALSLLILLAGYGLVISPWLIRNREVSGVWGLSSVADFNFFQYNVPEFMAYKNHSSPDSVRIEMQSKLSSAALRSAASLSSSAALRAVWLPYVLHDPIGYAKFHLVKTVPFFLSSGLRNFEISYNEIVKRPVFQTSTANMTNFLLHLQLRQFFAEIARFPLTSLEELGLLLVTLMALIPLFDRRRWFIAATFWLIILYFGLLTGSVAYARFRLPAAPFLFLLFSGAAFAARDRLASSPSQGELELRQP